MSFPLARQQRPHGARPAAAGHWPAVCFVLLVVASSDKWRLRDPTDAVSGAPDLATLVEVGTYVLVGAWLVRSSLLRWRDRRVPRTPQLAFAAAYVGLNALSVAYAPYPSYALVRAMEAVVVLLLALAVARAADRAQMHGLVHAFLGLVAASVAYGIAVPSAPVSALQVGRFTWLAVHPNVSSVFTALALVLATAYLTGDRVHPGPLWPRWAYAGLAALSAGALVLSQSRGAALGALAGATLVPLLQRRGRQRLLLALGIGVTGSLLAVAGSSLLIGFAARGEDASQLATLNARTDLWGIAWQAVRAQPLYGYGVGSIRGLFYSTTGLGGGHNEVVNVVVELGAVGLAAWTCFVVALLLRSRRAARSSGGAAEGDDDRALLTASVVALLVAGIFYDGAGAIATLSNTWLFIAAGWTSLLDRDRRPRTAQPLAVPVQGRPAAGRAPGAAPARR